MPIFPLYELETRRLRGMIEIQEDLGFDQIYRDKKHRLCVPPPPPPFADKGGVTDLAEVSYRVITFGFVRVAPYGVNDPLLCTMMRTDIAELSAAADRKETPGISLWLIEGKEPGQ